uniref:C2H2-type domain-containing protein n=1 Tax=Onchocerca flexuosa TaxID=387005 RepID=A0A183HNU4_9BILA
LCSPEKKKKGKDYKKLVYASNYFTLKLSISFLDHNYSGFESKYLHFQQHAIDFKVQHRTIKNFILANLPRENEQLHPCEICGRNFVKNSLVKHELVCRKMAKAKRKVFDSGKQRATGSDITIDNVINARKEREMVTSL